MDYKNNCLRREDHCRTAIEIINDSRVRIVLIVDQDQRLLGTVTDGDIRRMLLSKGELELALSEIMNRNFVSSHPETTEAEALAILTKNVIRHLPLIDSRGKLKGLYDLDSLLVQKKELPNAVLIMAGGEGRRLLPLTEHTPKPMLPVKGKPILEIIISQCIAAGFKKFYISVNYLKNSIKNYFGDGSSRGIEIVYLEETEPLGTGGALGLLPRDIKNPFFVINGDVLAKVDFLEMLVKHEQRSAHISVATRKYEVAVPYGVVDKEGGLVRDVLEKPTFEYFINTGVYIVDPKILKSLKLKSRIDMPDIVKMAIHDGHRVVDYDLNEYWLDIGLPQNLKQARSEWF